LKKNEMFVLLNRGIIYRGEDLLGLAARGSGGQGRQQC
jgi:hypothetical protein